MVNIYLIAAKNDKVEIANFKTIIKFGFEISENLHDSDIACVLIDKNSVNDSFVQDQIEKARKRNIPVLGFKKATVPDYTQEMKNLGVQIIVKDKLSSHSRRKAIKDVLTGRKPVDMI